jgi:hypothetical protein
MRVHFHLMPHMAGALWCAVRCGQTPWSGPLYCKRGLVNVRFAPKATEVLRCREAPLGAKRRPEQVQQAAPSFDYLIGGHE